MGTTGGLMTQTEARQLAKLLTTSTGMIHVAHTVPKGCWGGTEQGWAVEGPASDLQAEQARVRLQLIEAARAELRQAERARDWTAQLAAQAELDRLA
jgi:hypothetical protein